MQQDSLKKMASTFTGRIESVVEDMTIIFVLVIAGKGRREVT